MVHKKDEMVIMQLFFLYCFILSYFFILPLLSLRRVPTCARGIHACLFLLWRLSAADSRNHGQSIADDQYPV